MASFTIALTRMMLPMQLMAATIIFSLPSAHGLLSQCASDCFIAKSSAMGCHGFTSFQDTMDCWCKSDPYYDIGMCGEVCAQGDSWQHAFSTVCNGRTAGQTSGASGETLSVVPPGNVVGYQRVNAARDARQERRLATGNLLVEREAEAESKFKPISCTAPGITCGSGEKRQLDPAVHAKKLIDINAAMAVTGRDANPEADAESLAKFKPTSCTVPGVTCGSSEKRELDDTVDAEAVTVASRDAVAEAESLARFKPTSCTVPGITCGSNEKRETDPVVHDEAIVDDKAELVVAGRDALSEAESLTRFKPTSCTVPGITCGSSEKRNDELKSSSIELDSALDSAPEVLSNIFDPESCTVPGVTCGRIGGRDALSQPIADPDIDSGDRFKPTSCTAPGITCGVQVPTDEDDAPMTTFKKVVRSPTSLTASATTPMAALKQRDTTFDITKWLTLSNPPSTITDWSPHFPTDACTSPGITCAFIDLDGNEIENVGPSDESSSSSSSTTEYTITLSPASSSTTMDSASHSTT